MNKTLSRNPSPADQHHAGLAIAGGTLEALKWVALACMALDHVNKYLWGQRFGVAFELGRLAMPLFGFVLMYNLARPGACRDGLHARVARRLLVAGALAAPASVALIGGWPLNILFTLLAATCIVWLIERGGAVRRAWAVLVFVAAGAVVEFWWFGLLSCLGAWAFCRKPSGLRLAAWTAALSTLWIVNRSFAALACLPLVWTACRVEIPVPRHRWAFYAFYPAHLSAIALWVELN
ncbi:TraX family protein [Variovorax sp. J22R115]|uniref:TraX family protein n=1 Tax=Variovorax sp. J22R115 TaxID=3053509 RepID=UPI0025759380|nr:TraX family protein [Variovorax sp. J22R115]MDM0049765.1 TraX family protein [Variovorax sp. J22R115]